MAKLKDLSYTKQCLLVGKVAKMYDAGMYVPEIADALGEPVELIYEAFEHVMRARYKNS